MTDAVIVSTARTPLAKSWRGAFNMTHGATLGGRVLCAAIERAHLDPAEIEDVIIGCANPEGATGRNIARQIALRAGCPVTTSGMTVNRFCSSGCRPSRWRRRVQSGEGGVFAAGDRVDLVRQNEMNKYAQRRVDRRAQARLWRCSRPPVRVEEAIAREAQDRYGVEASGAPPRRAREVRRGSLPVATKMKVVDKQTGAESIRT